MTSVNTCIIGISVDLLHKLIECDDKMDNTLNQNNSVNNICICISGHKL